MTSKSERKREQLALQALGEQLISLQASDLEMLALDERLHKAIRDAAAIRSHGALRRQKQYIGKLMRDIDPEPVRAALARLNADEIRGKRLFAKAERWRDRLVNDGGPALEAFETVIGEKDATLGELLAELDVCFDDRNEKTLRRNIFRRVHEILGKIPQ